MVNKDEDPEYAAYADPEYQAYLKSQQPSVFNDYVAPALGILQSGINKIDSYTGAPVRAAIGAAEKSPSISQMPSAAYQAAKAQFGENPANAPTGKDLLAGAGINVPEKEIPNAIAGFSPVLTASKALGFKPTYNDVAGMAAESATNPLTYLPTEAIVSGASKVGKMAAPLVAKPLGWAAEQVTGIGRIPIGEYYENTADINRLISRYGGATQEYASDLRNDWQNTIQKFRRMQNNEISNVLDDFNISQNKVPADEINNSLLKGYGKTNAATQKIDRKTIGDLLSKVDQMTDQNGYMTLKDLHDFKQYAQGVGRATYDAGGGRIFPGGEWGEKVAAKSGDVARSLMIENAPPSISAAEAALSDLHGIEDTMQRNLLKPEAAPNAIYEAGVNAGGKSARDLKRLSDLTGYDFLKDARQFAATRNFATTGLTPIDTTGKTVARQNISKMVGQGLGAMAGYGSYGSKEAALAGGYLGGNAAQIATSPMALKGFINAADQAGNVPMGLLKASKLVGPSRRVTQGLLQGTNQ